MSPIYNQNDGLVEFTLVCHDVTVQKTLEKISRYDALTNIYNRRYYGEIAPKEIGRAKRDGKKISFAMIDIDFFKQYNDVYGHRKGDEALTKVASTLKKLKKRRGLCF